jgi:hypothetical protein
MSVVKVSASLRARRTGARALALIEGSFTVSMRMFLL